MNFLRAKLKSERGASILLAMVFFLLCLTVGGVVLTAATASAGRIASQRQTQQDYLTASSAAEALRDILNETSFTITATTTVVTGADGIPREESIVSRNLETAETKALQPALAAAAAAVSKGETASPVELTIEAEGLDDVSARLTVSDGLGDDKYTVTVTLSVGDGTDGGRQSVTLTVPAASASHDEERHVTENDPATGETVQTDTYRSVEKITWPRGAITKGAAA